MVALSTEVTVGEIPSEMPRALAWREGWPGSNPFSGTRFSRSRKARPSVAGYGRSTVCHNGCQFWNDSHDRQTRAY
jgi:hypothetical protein